MSPCTNATFLPFKILGTFGPLNSIVLELKTGAAANVIVIASSEIVTADGEITSS